MMKRYFFFLFAVCMGHTMSAKTQAEYCVSVNDTCMTETTNDDSKKAISVTPAAFTVIDGAILTADRSKTQSFSVPEMSQSELYKLVESGLTKMYPNLKKIATKVENESITVPIHGKAMADIDLTVIPVQKVDAEYVLKFTFHNGNIDIEVPKVEKFKSNGFSKSMAVLSLKQLGELDSKGVMGFGTSINNKINDILNKSFND